MADTDGNNILLLEHINLNHVKGRHDLVKAFYFDALGFAIDNRRVQNLEKGSGTLWANIGISQFHLPQDEVAQVIPGKIVLTYPDLSVVKEHLSNADPVLQSTKFSWEEQKETGNLLVTCPWGNRFEIIQGDDRDPRGEQNDNLGGARSLGCSLAEVVVHVPAGTNLPGVARFYEAVLGARAEATSPGRARVRLGPRQRLTFAALPAGAPPPRPYDGWHLAVYVRDLPGAFARADALGAVFVNPRFAGTDAADTLEEAMRIQQFRLRDVVDPEDPAAGAVLRLEHEVRGTRRASCPLRRPPAPSSSAAAAAAAAAALDSPDVQGD